MWNSFHGSSSTIELWNPKPLDCGPHLMETDHQVDGCPRVVEEENNQQYKFVRSQSAE